MENMLLEILGKLVLYARADAAIAVPSAHGDDE
jgi:hypothetical protein